MSMSRVLEITCRTYDLRSTPPKSPGGRRIQRVLILGTRKVCKLYLLRKKRDVCRTINSFSNDIGTLCTVDILTS